MLAVTHTFTGALIAVSVKEPALALPLALASHFVMDLLPHYGLPGDIAENRRLRSHRLIINTESSIAGLSLIVLPILLRDSVHPLITFGCMFLAVLPDLVWLAKFTIYKLTGKLPAYGRFSVVHKKMQWAEMRVGIIFDLAWLVAVSILISLSV